MADWHEGDMYVIEGISFLGGEHAVASSDWRPFRDFLQALPENERATQPSAAASSSASVTRPAAERAKFVAENPWLLEVLAPLKEASRKRSRKAAGPDDMIDDECAGEDFANECAEPEAVAEQFWADLAVAKGQARGHDDDHFVVRPLGGTWTHTHLQVAFDAWQARASTASAREWLDAYHIQRAARFDVSLYTSAGALICAQYWARKLGCYHRAWLDAGGRFPHTFSEAELALFQEPAEFTELSRSCRAAAAQKRFAQLRDLAPRGEGLAAGRSRG